MTVELLLRSWIAGLDDDIQWSELFLLRVYDCTGPSLSDTFFTILQLFQTGVPTCESGDSSDSASIGRQIPSIHNDSPAENTTNDDQGAVVRIQ